MPDRNGIDLVLTDNYLAGPSSQIAFLQRVYERLVMCQFPGSEDSEQEIPTAIRNWRLERFLFSMPRASLSEPSSGAVLPRHLGDLFIRSYFKLVHPQLPILDYQKVVSQWVASWEAHDVMDENSALRHQGKEIMFMAIAVGARVCPIINQDGFRLAEAWAEHFSQRVEIPFSALEEPSLHVVRVFLLKVCPASYCDVPLFMCCNLRGSNTIYHEYLANTSASGRPFMRSMSYAQTMPTCT